MKHLIIRPAALSDLGLVQQIGRETFYETFAQSNSENDMQKYLDESFHAEKIASELTNPDSHFFLAMEADTPIGYLKLNTGAAQTDIRDAAAIEIERIYVKSDFHGKKVGQLLYEKALEVARDLRKEYIWLGVWEENPKAIRFYEKNGFVVFDKHIFVVGTDEQMDLLMKKTLI
jgi:ribosomal protein S18 acetylase RimI-like enzyme